MVPDALPDDRAARDLLPPAVLMGLFRPARTRLC
jgi:hypothetical protein